MKDCITCRELFFKVSQREIAVALKEQKNVGFRHVYNSAVIEGYCNQLMETLDAGNRSCYIILNIFLIKKNGRLHKFNSDISL